MFEYNTNDDFETDGKYRFDNRIINKLYEILLNECNFKKFKKAFGDEKYRYILLKEYHLI